MKIKTPSTLIAFFLVTSISYAGECTNFEGEWSGTCTHDFDGSGEMKTDFRKMTIFQNSNCSWWTIDQTELLLGTKTKTEKYEGDSLEEVYHTQWDENQTSLTINVNATLVETDSDGEGETVTSHQITTLKLVDEKLELSTQVDAVSPDEPEPSSHHIENCTFERL